MNRLQYSTRRTIPLVLLFAAILLSACTSPAPVTVSSESQMKQSDFRAAMRKLWEDHITWTRLYIVAAAADAPNADATAQRLLQNQTDIGNAIKPYYGDDAGNQLTALLEDHINIAVEIIAAAKAGDTAAFDEANARWNTNADDIAIFLNKANPDNWPLDDLKEAMHMHLTTTLDEANAHLTGDWEADVAAYDAVHDHILKMADILSTGIIKQFPDKFQ
jgi:hypothetical protein